MTREVAALIAQMPFILYALISLAVVIAVPHSQWNLLAVAAPYFLGPTISKRYTTLRDATSLAILRIDNPCPRRYRICAHCSKEITHPIFFGWATFRGAFWATFQRALTGRNIVGGN